MALPQDINLGVPARGPQGPAGTFDDSKLAEYATKTFVNDKTDTKRIDDVDLNTITQPGKYFACKNCSNKPNTPVWGHLLVFGCPPNNNQRAQLWIDDNAHNQMYYRILGNHWTTWTAIARSSDIPDHVAWTQTHNNGGGVNLLKDTQTFSNDNWSRDSNITVTSNANNATLVSQNVNSRIYQAVFSPTYEKTFSLSFEARISADCEDESVLVRVGPYNASKRIEITGKEYRRYKAENWQWTSNNSSSFNFFIENGKIDLKDLKLEYGVVATPYSPAPADKNKHYPVHIYNNCDLNTITDSGFYFVKVGTNLPSSHWGYLTVIKGNNTRICQIWQDDTAGSDGSMYWRVNQNSWSAWRKIPNSNDLASFATQEWVTNLVSTSGLNVFTKDLPTADQIASYPSEIDFLSNTINSELPTPNRGIMITIRGNNLEDSGNQFWLSDSGTFWVRAKNGNTLEWKEWHQLNQQPDLSPYLTKSVAESTYVTKESLNISTSEPGISGSPADYQTGVTQKVKSTTAIGINLSKYDSNCSCTKGLLTTKKVNDTLATQSFEALDGTNANMWIRKANSSSTWSTWRLVTSWD